MNPTTITPSYEPTSFPHPQTVSIAPSYGSTQFSSKAPSEEPSVEPTVEPSLEQSLQNIPSASGVPSKKPTVNQIKKPSLSPATKRTVLPTVHPAPHSSTRTPTVESPGGVPKQSQTASALFSVTQNITASSVDSSVVTLLHDPTFIEAYLNASGVRMIGSTKFSVSCKLIQQPSSASQLIPELSSVTSVRMLYDAYFDFPVSDLSDAAVVQSQMNAAYLSLTQNLVSSLSNGEFMTDLERSFSRLCGSDVKCNAELSLLQSLTFSVPSFSSPSQFVSLYPTTTPVSLSTSVPSPSKALSSSNGNSGAGLSGATLYALVGGLVGVLVIIAVSLICVRMWLKRSSADRSRDGDLQLGYDDFKKSDVSGAGVSYDIYGDNANSAKIHRLRGSNNFKLATNHGEDGDNISYDIYGDSSVSGANLQYKRSPKVINGKESPDISYDIFKDTAGNTVRVLRNPNMKSAGGGDREGDNLTYEFYPGDSYSGNMANPTGRNRKVGNRMVDMNMDVMYDVPSDFMMNEQIPAQMRVEMARYYANAQKSNAAQNDKTNSGVRDTAAGKSLYQVYNALEMVPIQSDLNSAIPTELRSELAKYQMRTMLKQTAEMDKLVDEDMRKTRQSKSLYNFYDSNSNNLIDLEKVDNAAVYEMNPLAALNKNDD